METPAKKQYSLLDYHNLCICDDNMYEPLFPHLVEIFQYMDVQVEYPCYRVLHLEKVGSTLGLRCIVQPRFVWSFISLVFVIQ